MRTRLLRWLLRGELDDPQFFRLLRRVELATDRLRRLRTGSPLADDMFPPAKGDRP